MRAFGATYFNYIGKPLAYVLDTPEQPDDADNPLRRGFGNEASDADLSRFGERFGVPAHRRVRPERDRRVDQPRAGHAGGRAREAATDTVRIIDPDDHAGVPAVRASTATAIAQRGRGHG